MHFSYMKCFSHDLERIFLFILYNCTINSAVQNKIFTMYVLLTLQLFSIQYKKQYGKFYLLQNFSMLKNYLFLARKLKWLKVPSALALSTASTVSNAIQNGRLWSTTTHIYFFTRSLLFNFTTNPLTESEIFHFSIAYDKRNKIMTSKIQ